MLTRLPDISGASDGKRLRMLLAGAAAILILLIAIVQLNSFRENRNLRDRVDQSYNKQLLLDRLLSLHQDIETGQRGYALTGNREFLQPYEAAVPDIAKALRRLREVTGNPATAGHVRELEGLSARKLAISARVIEVRSNGEDAAARELIGTAEGKRVMDRFRAQISLMRQAELRDFNQLLESTSTSNTRTLLSTGAIEALLLALLGAAFLAYMSNLSRLARVTAAARDTSRRQVAIFDSANDAMLVIDGSGCVEGINPAALRLFGLDAAAANGRRVGELFAGGKLDIESFTPRSASGETRNIAQLTAVRGDGSSFEAEVASSAVLLAGGLRTLLIVRDATERNRMERMKNEFVSTVSHELRTPLTSIRGAVTLLDHGVGKTLDPKWQQLLSIAMSNSQRLSLLIDDILSIEKLGSGRLEFELRPIDLRQPISDAVEQNRTYAADRDVRLELTTPAEPLPIEGDPGRLVQAFTNLLSNAAKFSPKGKVVSIIAEQVDGKARVSVADQGPGIPAEFRPRLFERFSQAQGQETGRSGTGLGLAITKSIVERHGGSIGYETGLGGGTLFWIDLPLTEGQAN